MIAPKNLGRSPSFTKIDIRLSQTIPLIRGTRLKVFADIENFLNLLNSDWGSLRQVGFPYFSPTVLAACAVQVGNSCTRYRYSNFQAPQTQLVTRQSLYQIRVGAKFEF